MLHSKTLRRVLRAIHGAVVRAVPGQARAGGCVEINQSVGRTGQGSRSRAVRDPRRQAIDAMPGRWCEGRPDDSVGRRRRM